jgi:2-oxoglutarate ferredoxin oxidoreductase subunit beta
MPSVLTGANLANRDLIYLGVSGDGDPASIGLGSIRARHAPRRQHGLYRGEQRRLRPHQGPVLATADRGSKSKRVDQQRPAIDLADGAAARRGFVARSFPATRSSLCRSSGRRSSTRRGLDRRDLALRRLQQSRGSTKSFDYVREHNEAVNRLDSSPRRRRSRLPTSRRVEVVEQHDLAKLGAPEGRADYDPTTGSAP